MLASVFPVGIDSTTMGRLASAAEARRHAARMVDSLAGRKLILGVDRLDYTKGIDRRFNAYRRFLELNPEYRAQVSLLQIASPSRDEVAEYQVMRLRLESLAGEINGHFADYDWVPLRYVNQTYGHGTLAGLYRAAAAALVTPLRDGMNLVAKEYIAAQNPNDPGVLILSRFAGAAAQLKEALIVNPYDQDSMVDALRRALSMPLDERASRWQTLHANVTRDNIEVWRNSFLAALESVRAPQRATYAETRTFPPTRTVEL
jgi:trehalose 6-phosphate synthase